MRRITLESIHNGKGEKNRRREMIKKPTFCDLFFFFFHFQKRQVAHNRAEFSHESDRRIACMFVCVCDESKVGKPTPTFRF